MGAQSPGPDNLKVGAEVILMFLRHPTPGTTKTRLIPSLGPDGAAEAAPG